MKTENKTLDLKMFWDIFKKYLIYKKRLSANFIKENKITEIDIADVKQYLIYQKHVIFVESILDSLDSEEADLIKGVFLENKDWRDFHYSYSNFYAKLKKAKNTFAKYWDI